MMGAGIKHEGGMCGEEEFYGGDGVGFYEDVDVTGGTDGHAQGDEGGGTDDGVLLVC